MFLLNLAERHRCRGYSATEYVLRLTREEIGRYLGHQLETVSRLFCDSSSRADQVQGSTVKLLDPSHEAARRPAPLNHRRRHTGTAGCGYSNRDIML